MLQVFLMQLVEHGFWAPQDTSRPCIFEVLVFLRWFSPAYIDCTERAIPTETPVLLRHAFYTTRHCIVEK